MQVLIAFDGSEGSTRAAGLVEASTWPEDFVVRVVTIVEPVVIPLRGPWSGDPHHLAILAEAEQRNAEVVHQINAPGRSAMGAVLTGRAATVILDEAETFRADLIVLGSRGLGQIRSLLLGSVSTEVTDHAPCPVLTARTSSITRVVFATDDSRSARAAEALLAEWSIFERLPIQVVSVAHVIHPWTTGITPTLYGPAMEAYAAEMHDAKASHLTAAEQSAERLRRAGRLAEPEVRTGDPAAEIIAAAADRAADLIVLGSRGRTGLARLLLGSVARNVLSGSHASVLIVHDRATREP